MPKSQHNFLEKLWYQKNFFTYCLLPLSFIYRLIICMRHWLYQFGIKKITRLNVPVIVIGNITLGGTGKTPLIIWLAIFLTSKNYKVGIVSRGYKGNYKNTLLEVTKESQPIEVGDEAALIKRHIDVPLVVSKKRGLAAEFLAKNHHCNVILSDDGLQHYALGRDIEIAVIDGIRRFGNGYCLPAGCLREPTARLKKVDIRITQGKAQENEIGMQLVPENFKNLKNNKLNFDKVIQTKPIHAVAGIGNPDRFFKLLTKLGVEFTAHAFPDHHHFTPQELDFGSEANIIMTEKDAVKCLSFANDRYWYLPVTAKLESKFDQLFLNKLNDIVKH